ncbi:MAG: GAF domain-containing protein, partial [Cytophagales bacterium]|nr:GAF domain-containing protein [Cytophagales bacterium]
MSQSTWSLKTLLNVGVIPSNTQEINQKITLSNGIAYYFIFLSTVYVGIAIAFMPIVLPYALISLVLYILVPFLNQSGQHVLSRYIAATNPSIVSFFIHISTISVNESAVPGNYLIQFSLMVLPWILFDSKEKLHLAITFNFCALLILLVNPLNGLIEPDATMNSAMTKSAGMELVFILTAISILGVSLFILQRINAQSENEIAKLVKEASLKNEELRANEDKLNKYIAEIEETRIEDKKREWTNNGLAKFADILRSQNNDIQASYDAIITNLVKYLDANQGGLFVVEGEDNSRFIELKSYYAYERKKYLEKRIEIGEGLIGQCYLEKDIVYLTKVPENYISITSGMGEATPRAVLLVPLMLNEEVFGVIELASFKP